MIMSATSASNTNYAINNSAPSDYAPSDYAPPSNDERIIRPRVSPENTSSAPATSLAAASTQLDSDQLNLRRLSIRNYASVVRQTSRRLTRTVREATSDGSLGSMEISHLHIWVTADLVPWAVESVELVDDTAKRQALTLIAELKRLDSELSAALGDSAADIADQVRRTGSAIVRILVKDN